MEKLLKNLKEAIKYYEDCVNNDVVKPVLADSLITLGCCCQELDKKCQAMFNAILNDN